MIACGLRVVEVSKAEGGGETRLRGLNKPTKLFGERSFVGNKRYFL